MLRILLILLTLSKSISVLSQPASFDKAVRQLFFDVNIYKASSSIVDSFERVADLKYNDTVVNQWSLSASLFLETKEEAWTSGHKFSFSKSPIAGFKIRSGQIIVRLVETSTTKKVMGLEWEVDFNNKKEGELFYNKLKEIFAPLSTKQKTEYDNFVGDIAQYSTRNENEKGVRDISIYFGKSSRKEKYQIMLTLFNEFAAEEVVNTEK